MLFDMIGMHVTALQFLNCAVSPFTDFHICPFVPRASLFVEPVFGEEA